MIAIVDTGGANIASIVDAFGRLGRNAVLSKDPELLNTASHLILPGVGAAEDSMERLRQSNLIQTIRSFRQPVLGICLGLQLLFERSEEGPTECLGLLPGTVKLLRPGEPFCVPHMGWNQVSFAEPSRPALFKNIDSGSYFYFVHSYAIPDGPWVKATSQHGACEIPVAIEYKNFFGVQFHPERSADLGLQVFRSFVEL